MSILNKFDKWVDKNSGAIWVGAAAFAIIFLISLSTLVEYWQKTNLKADAVRFGFAKYEVDEHGSTRWQWDLSKATLQTKEVKQVEKEPDTDYQVDISFKL